MKSNYKTLAAAAIALLFLAACGSSGGLGDILGGTNSGNGTYNNQLRGTVDSVDLQSSSIFLINVSQDSSMLSSGGNGNGVRVYFDNRTSVDYNGRSYRPEDLERGDQVSVRVDQSSGNRIYASSMSVLQDARNSGGSYPSGGNYPNNGGYPSNGSYGSNVRGTVRNIDTSRRTIEIDSTGGYNQSTRVEYDANTHVQYGGNSYRPQDLERGDEIDVRVRDIGNGRRVADNITVTRSISGGSGNNGTYGSGPSSQQSTIRGTVQYVDTNRRAIELSSVSWSNFNRGSGSGGSTIVVQYDTKTQVDVQGQAHPVSGLERGDVIDVQVQNTGSSNNYFAQRIYLVRDVNSR